MKIAEAITFADIAKLPKKNLEEISTLLALDSNDRAFNLARNIWGDLRSKSSEERDRVLSGYYNKFFAGNTSVSWFTCDSLEGLKEGIISKEDYNPFEQKIPYDTAQLGPSPILRSAVEIDASSYYLRFIYQDGTRRIYGEDIEVLPTTKTATVYINETVNLVEVREKPEDAEKIAGIVASYVNQQITLDKINFLAPFGSEIESIADKLENGRLYESKAFPETFIDTFSEKENDAIVNILGAIDQYYEYDDIDALQQQLEEAKSTLGDELLTSPFIAIILAGMGNLGLKVDENDLRHTPFYNLLRPYLQASGGYVKFTVEINNVVQEFSINVGVKPKSIYFKSNKTTEEVINEVREKVILFPND
ncbi:hypothetical protein [Rossellomorea sp. LjRoot5]|uniref:hypothetical protein n=1 Tax=Rossellomorea sp. LjRoot5 TaxID=3342331 RepID=UPI003ECF9D26